MVDPIRELKTRAEILHSRVASGSPEARRRLRALAELATANDHALAVAAPRLLYTHCLLVVAREHGFSTWAHAWRVLQGDVGETDFGTLLYDTRSIGEALNVWFANYDEARGHLDEVRGRGARHYLLAYRKQFFVADAYFVEPLGLAPDDADWQAIDCDWPRAADRIARGRLYQKRLVSLRVTL